MPPTLLLIRHGQTLANAQGRMHDTDLGLTPEGFQQAQALIPHCQTYGISHLLCSTAQRAIQTAQPIADALNLPLQTTPLLLERNWGVWSGLTWAEVQKYLDGLSLEERFVFRPPAGESWADLEQRLNMVQKMLIPLSTPTAIVAHGGCLRAWLPMLLHQPCKTSFQYDLPNGGFLVLKGESDRFVVLAHD